MLAPFSARAQVGFTVVTAQVIDPNGNNYSNCSVQVTYVPAPTAATVLPTLFGVQVRAPGGTYCDVNGNFTVIVADNTQIMDGHAGGGATSQWRFTICAAFGMPCFAYTTAVSGSSQNLSTQIQAVATLLIAIPNNLLGSTGAVGKCPTPNAVGYTVWGTCGGGGGSPGGFTNNVQYNTGFIFGGAPNFSYTAATGVVGISQFTNSSDSLFMSRFTDTAPTGNFERYRNAALNTDLWTVDVTGTLQAGNVPAGRIPASVVYNNQANTYSGGLQDLSSATLRLPSIASYTPTTASLCGWDPTNSRLVCGNGTNTSFMTSITAAPTTGHCPQFSGITGLLVDSGSTNCGGGGSTAWSAIGNPAGNLILSMAGNTSEFDYTSAQPDAFEWANTTAATGSVSQSSPLLALEGQYWNGAASAADVWAVENVIANGTNGNSTFTLTHSGSSGLAQMSIPGNLLAGGSVATGGATATFGTGGGISMNEGTAATAAPGTDICYADSTSHSIRCSNNNGTFLILPYETGTMISGDLIIVNATTNLIQDAGIVAANVTTSPVTQTSGIPVLGNGTKSLAQLTDTADSGVANAYVVSPTTAIAALVDGAQVRFHTANANSGASTINVSGLGVKNLTKKGATALVSGDILPSPSIYDAVYDGTQWELLEPSSGGAGSSALSSITPATGTNTIASGNNPQTWNWAQTTDAQDAFTFGETSAATGGTITNALANQAELHVSTASGSTATPFEIDQAGVTGATGPPLLQLESTWNNASLVGEGILLNVTNTSSAAASALEDLRVGNTTEWKMDKAGNGTAATSLATGTAPSCTPGTAGVLCQSEGTAPTAASAVGQIYTDSTLHDLAVQVNGGSPGAGKGILEHVTPGQINQTAQTAAITTATLCAAAAGACNQVGQYKVNWNFWGSGTACSSVTAGSVTFLLTWTDENAVSHAAVALQMMSQTGAATEAMQSSFPFQTALANESASGTFTFSTNGTVIQYATGYTACTTGTGTYNLRAEVTRMQ
jgi:hypothetical protein